MTPPTSSGGHLERRLRLKRAYGGESPYAENSDHDAASESSGDAAYFHSPVTPTSGLAVVNWGVHTRSYLPNGPSHSLSAAMNHQHHQNVNSHSTNSGINISGMGMGMGGHHGHGHAHTHNHKLMNAHVGLNSTMLVGPNGTNPWLSAIPRSIGGFADMAAGWRTKRRAEELEDMIPNERDRERELNIQRLHPTDEEYDGEESASATGDEKSPSRDYKVVALGTPLIDGASSQYLTQDSPKRNEKVTSDQTTMAAGDEKKAALLLMKLSVKDGEAGAALPAALPTLPSVSAVGTPMMGSAKWCKDEADSDGPRVKRRRALSM